MPGGTEENHEIPVRVGLNQRSPEYEAGVLMLYNTECEWGGKMMMNGE
jgi:hypothetical protein